MLDIRTTTKSTFRIFPNIAIIEVSAVQRNENTNYSIESKFVEVNGESKISGGVYFLKQHFRFCLNELIPSYGFKRSTNAKTAMPATIDTNTFSAKMLYCPLESKRKFSWEKVLNVLKPPQNPASNKG